MITKYRIPLLGAMLVSIIMVAPHLLFIVNEGDAYRGIYQMSTDSEDVYLARMHEIIDGHPTLGAVPYAEYKDRSPLMFPTTIDFLIAGTSKLLGASLSVVLLATKALLPALLFFLAYQLVIALCAGTDRSSALTAFAGASAVVLAYDLTGLGSITGLKSISAFLLWSRPVNPIMGALLLFGFLLLLWRVRNDQKIRPRWIVAGGALFGLMISSYFFSWGFALAFMAFWVLLQFVSGRRYVAYSVLLIASIGFLLASPYLYQTRLTATHSDFAFAAAKQGLLYSHAPIGSSIVVTALIILGGAALIRRASLHEDWWRLSLALTLGGALSLNQQLITGVTIWPFHFIQYIKPFSMVILLVALFHILRPWVPRLFPFLMLGSIVVSFAFGSAVQVGAYRNSFSWYAERQRYGDLFEWLNQNAPKDCAVLPQDDADGTFMYWIPAFTHCNSVVNRNSHYLIPPDRIFHDFLVILRMRGVSAIDIGTYLAEHRGWVIGHFYGPQSGGSIAREYREYQQQKNIIGRLEAEYPAFLRRDFLTELKKYRIDYVVADGALQPNLIRALHLGAPVATPGGVAVYRVP